MFQQNKHYDGETKKSGERNTSKRMVTKGSVVKTYLVHHASNCVLAQFMSPLSFIVSRFLLHLNRILLGYI